MYRVQKRIFCVVCNKSYVANIYPKQLKAQGNKNNVLKEHSTNSTIEKHTLPNYKRKLNLLTI